MHLCSTGWHWQTGLAICGERRADEELASIVYRVPSVD